MVVVLLALAAPPITGDGRLDLTLVPRIAILETCHASLLDTF